MNANTFREHWEKYAIKVFPADAGHVQRQESRRAFYSGAIALLSTIVCAMSEGLEPTAEDMRAFSNLKDELDQFARDVSEGRA